MRNAIIPMAKLCTTYCLPGWRKVNFICKEFKRKINNISKSKHTRRTDKEQRIKDAYTSLLDYSQNYIKRMNTSFEWLALQTVDLKVYSKIEVIQEWIRQAENQISQIERRVFKGETIPHSEKIFSVFEPHTRWISKGKAGVPVELGLPVSIFKDQYGFILGYHIMKTESDVDVCVPFTMKVAATFPSLVSASYDKGFWSPENMEKVSEIIDFPAIPKKGRLSIKEQQRQKEVEFIKQRKAHPAVESAINGLEHSGLDKCPDRKLTGFERYVGLAVLSRNLQTLGKVIHEKKKKKFRRKKLKIAA